MSDIYLYNQKVLNSNGTVSPALIHAAHREWQARQARYNASDGISRYNALEATLAHKHPRPRSSATYTWSKCLANTLGYFGSYGDEEGAGESQTQATQNFFQNEYNPKGDYGRCTIDAALTSAPMASIICPSAAAS